MIVAARQITDAARQWDALTVKERLRLLQRAMPGERWSDLRQRMAGSNADRLTALQQEALPDIMKGTYR